jgi:hypothetical protein
MTTQLVKSHWYGVVAAAAAGATYSRNQSTGVVTFTSGGSTLWNDASIDRLICTDDIVAFDWYSSTGQVYRLYRAAFGRTPDKAGLSGNISTMDGGVSLDGIAQAFIASQEFINLYGSNPPNFVFIQALYLHVLGREPSSDEVNAWVQIMNNGATRSQVLIGFSESTENQNAVNATYLYPGVLLTKSYFGI